MRLRPEAETSFVRGVADPSLLVERFVSRSTLMNRWLRTQASLCGLPYVVLSGSESPHGVSSRCLEAIGLDHAAAE
jgi:hypothetical protein